MPNNFLHGRIFYLKGCVRYPTIGAIWQALLENGVPLAKCNGPRTSTIENAGKKMNLKRKKAQKYCNCDVHTTDRELQKGFNFKVVNILNIPP